MATDRLMNAFGKSLPATVALYQEAFNGEQAHTHALGFTFSNAEQMQELGACGFPLKGIMEWEKR